MFVDMPPGTGDVPLTVFQSLPVDGVIVVASPQELVGMIVEKAVNMAAMMKKNVVGLVENMSYYVCPDCGAKHEIFGASRADGLAALHGIPNVAKLPIDPRLAACVLNEQQLDIIVIPDILCNLALRMACRGLHMDVSAICQQTAHITAAPVRLAERSVHLAVLDRQLPTRNNIL